MLPLAVQRSQLDFWFCYIIAKEVQGPSQRIELRVRSELQDVRKQGEKHPCEMMLE